MAIHIKGQVGESTGGGGSTTPIATTTVAGKVMPDGVTINVTGLGQISVPTATASALGIVKVDGTTMKVGTDGTISSSVVAASYVSVANQAARLALTQTTDLIICVQADANVMWYLNANQSPAVAGNWIQGPSTASSVTSFNSRTGAVTPVAGDYRAYYAAYDSTKVYYTNESVVYTDGLPYVANGSIIGGTVWAIGTTGATWRLLTPEASTTTDGLLASGDKTKVNMLPSSVASGSMLVANTANTLAAINSTSGIALPINNAGTTSFVTASGTGAPVLATSPTINTPTITSPVISSITSAVATALSLNATSGTGNLQSAGSTVLSWSSSSLTPTTTDTYNLGSASNEFNNVYTKTANVNGISISGAATAGQVLTASSTTAASWATPSTPVMTGATASVAGTSGVVPSSTSGFQDASLKADAVWDKTGRGVVVAVSLTTSQTLYPDSAEYLDITASSASLIATINNPTATTKARILKITNGGSYSFTVSYSSSSSLVPAGSALELAWSITAQTWELVGSSAATDYVGASSSIAGVHGLVPSASIGSQDAVLKGAGDWDLTGRGVYATLADQSTSGTLTASTSVDICEYLQIAQATTGITTTLPIPTVTTKARRVVVINTGSVSLTVNTTTVAAGQYAIFIWGANASVWATASTAATASVKNNLTATVDPVKGSDSSLGYSAGSIWINTNTGVTWTCQNSAIGAAVWLSSQNTSYVAGWSDLVNLLTNATISSVGTYVVVNLATGGAVSGATFAGTSSAYTPSTVITDTGSATYYVNADYYSTGSVNFSVTCQNRVANSTQLVISAVYTSTTTRATAVTSYGSSDFYAIWTVVNASDAGVITANAIMKYMKSSSSWAIYQSFDNAPEVVMVGSSGSWNPYAKTGATWTNMGLTSSALAYGHAEIVTGQGVSTSAGVWTRVSGTLVNVSATNITNTSGYLRFTAKQAGTYRVDASGGLFMSVVQWGNIAIYKNGVAVSTSSNAYVSTAGSAVTACTGSVLNLVVGDYIDLYVYTTNAGSFYGGYLTIQQIPSATYVPAQAVTPVNLAYGSLYLPNTGSQMQALVAATTTRFASASIVSNVSNMTTTAGYFRLTASQTGIYKVSAGVSMGGSAATSWNYFYLYKNGSSYLQFGQTFSSTAGSSTISSGDIIMSLSSGDYIDLYGSTGNTGSLYAGYLTVTQVPNATYIPATAVATSFVGASSSTAGAFGGVPAPAAGQNTSFLRGDATWTGLNESAANTLSSATATALTLNGTTTGINLAVAGTNFINLTSTTVLPTTSNAVSLGSSTKVWSGIYGNSLSSSASTLTLNGAGGTVAVQSAGSTVYNFSSTAFAPAVANLYSGSAAIPWYITYTSQINSGTGNGLTLAAGASAINSSIAGTIYTQLSTTAFNPYGAASLTLGTSSAVWTTTYSNTVTSAASTALTLNGTATGVNFQVAAATKASMTATAFYPATTAAMTSGLAANVWSQTWTNAVYSASATNLMLGVNAVSLASLSTTAFYPTTSTGISLGSSTNLWGTVYSNNGTISTSDRRAKKQIVDLDNTDSLGIVKQLPAVSYLWDDGREDDTLQLGWIAQDIETYIPSAIHVGTSVIRNETGELVETDDYKMVDKAQLQAINWSATRQLISMVEALQAKVAELEAKLSV